MGSSTGNIETQEELRTTGSKSLDQTFKLSDREVHILIEMVKKRMRLNHPHLCNVVQYDMNNLSNKFISCEQMHILTIRYSKFECFLSDKRSTFPLPSGEVQSIIYSITDAVSYLDQYGIRHGDICPARICFSNAKCMLIDNQFLQRGITAFEKILEGEESFISPSQMEKIRYGYIRESPKITEGDDVFALGMTCLEIMSGKSSRECYKQSYNRLNEGHIKSICFEISKKYPSQLCSLVFSMLCLNEQNRATFKQIRSNPLIARYSPKMNLRK